MCYKENKSDLKSNKGKLIFSNLDLFDCFKTIYLFPTFTRKSDEGERGMDMIRVMNEEIQKHLIKKTTFLKVKRNVEKSSFVKGTVCFRYV